MQIVFVTKKVRTKLFLLPKISGVEVAPCLLTKIFRVKVTPSVTSVESSGQFWRKICQIWRIWEPWYKEQGRHSFFFTGGLLLRDWNQGLTELDMNDLNTVWERTPTFLSCASALPDKAPWSVNLLYQYCKTEIIWTAHCAGKIAST